MLCLLLHFLRPSQFSVDSLKYLPWILLGGYYDPIGVRCPGVCGRVQIRELVTSIFFFFHILDWAHSGH